MLAKIKKKGQYSSGLPGANLSLLPMKLCQQHKNKQKKRHSVIMQLQKKIF